MPSTRLRFWERESFATRNIEAVSLTLFRAMRFLRDGELNSEAFSYPTEMQGSPSIDAVLVLTKFDRRVKHSIVGDPSSRTDFGPGHIANDGAILTPKETTCLDRVL
jgi:hypothetical protein